MSAFLTWLVAHVVWVLVGNLIAGCYALVAYLPELDLRTECRAPTMRVLVVCCCAAFGLPVLVALVAAEALERRGLYYPPS